MSDDPIATIRTIQDRLRGIVGPFAGPAIVRLLEQVPAPQLGEVLAAIDVEKLFGLFWWRLAPGTYDRLLTLLCVERVEALDVPVRAQLVTALQAGRTRGRDERAIRDLFLATRGAALTELKNRVDAGGDYRDLQQLIHHDLDNPQIQSAILQHIAEHSGPDTGELKVLSDVDDTLYSSGFTKNDPRYPSGTVYPGVVELYVALAGSPTQGQTNLGFLTARPWERSGGVEHYTQKSLKKKGVPEHVVLSGDIRDLSHRAMADKKLENFEQYRALFPEYGFVFIGDSGQGDALLGGDLMRLPEIPVKAVFIHWLSPDTRPTAEDEALGVCFVDSYLGAAIKAHEMGLIDDGGRAAVASAVRGRLSEDFAEATLAMLKRDLAQLED